MNESGDGSAQRPGADDSERVDSRENGPPSRVRLSSAAMGKVLLLTLVMLRCGVRSLMAVALNWTYSAGRGQASCKNCAKRIVCKTWEGISIRVKGFRAGSFQFTVRSDSMARCCSRIGKEVTSNTATHWSANIVCLAIRNISWSDCVS